MLVSLISRLVACSPRIVVDKQTDRQTDTQNDYCNPRCACAPRVNNIITLHITCIVHPGLDINVVGNIVILYGLYHVFRDAILSLG